ncbi:DUF5131 family protein [Nocardia shimofusensis]|uniref:DUF5131 family protein n=1 Tax=Nocardia shimofusensis TaxID=228596 RepID=UPI000A01A0D4
MADGTGIEWTQATWNPTTGCDRISPGCDNCYALTLAKRLKAMGNPKYQSDGDPRTSGPGFAITEHPSALDIPHHWSAPRLIFVNSMSDLFHARVSSSFIREVFQVMEATPRHTYQLLTKRPKRAASMAAELPWPSNVWLGVSVETSDQLWRLDALRRVPAATRFVSAEPLLDSLAGIDLSGMHWLIAGGESGPRHRELDPVWVRELRDACCDQDVAFFFKLLCTTAYVKAPLSLKQAQCAFSERSTLRSNRIGRLTSGDASADPEASGPEGISEASRSSGCSSRVCSRRSARSIRSIASFVAFESAFEITTSSRPMRTVISVRRAFTNSGSTRTAAISTPTLPAINSATTGSPNAEPGTQMSMSLTPAAPRSPLRDFRSSSIDSEPSSAPQRPSSTTNGCSPYPPMILLPMSVFVAGIQFPWAIVPRPLHVTARFAGEGPSSRALLADISTGSVA